MPKSTRGNEKLLKTIGSIAHKLNKLEMESNSFRKLRKDVKKLLKTISKNKELIKLCENPKIEKMANISKRHRMKTTKWRHKSQICEDFWEMVAIYSIIQKKLEK